MRLEAFCAFLLIAVVPLLGSLRGRKSTSFSRILKAFPAIALAALALTASPLHAQDKSRTPIRKVLPVYPPIAKQMGMTGQIMVNITVDPSGKVVQAVASNGSKIFIPAVIDALKQWQYTPSDSTDTFAIDIVFERN